MCSTDECMQVKKIVYFSSDVCFYWSRLVSQRLCCDCSRRRKQIWELIYVYQPVFKLSVWSGVAVSRAGVTFQSEEVSGLIRTLTRLKQRPWSREEVKGVGRGPGRSSRVRSSRQARVTVIYGWTAVVEFAGKLNRGFPCQPDCTLSWWLISPTPAHLVPW